MAENFKKSAPWRKLVLGAVALAVSVPAVFAQSKPDLSGFWELHFDSRNVPAAELTPEAKAVPVADQAKRDQYAIRWCHNMGIPFLMGLSPIDILQDVNGKEVAITFPYRGSSRHIYTDGREHVNLDIFDPSSFGNSIGHWEGDTLVVDTVGLSEEGVRSIPGGGQRGLTSHLVERFRLLKNGSVLSVTSTWTDAKVFAAPHTYEFWYYRAPKGSEAREQVCNASDEERGAFLLGTPGR